MRAKMRAKMKVVSVELLEHGEILRMKPVCGNASFGSEGESEDNTYARFTPSGSLDLLVNSPTLVGEYKPGQIYYVDFTPAD